jgi:hypothetical protein
VIPFKLESLPKEDELGSVSKGDRIGEEELDRRGGVG